MTEIEINKNHWYDGWFYDRIIAHNQDAAFAILKSMIPEQSAVLDVGCGTGRLVFTLADTCRRVDGIDLSQRNIGRAQTNLLKYPAPNIAFFHDNIISYVLKQPMRYEYAVLSYIIHEVHEAERNSILEAVARIAEQIILVDYISPQPSGLRAGLNEVVEYIAGSDHYKNFRSYLRNGGIRGLAKQSGFAVIGESKIAPSTCEIAVLKKTGQTSTMNEIKLPTET